MDLTIAVIGPLRGGEAVVAQPMLAAIRAAVVAHGRCSGGQVAVRALDDDRDPARAAELVAQLAEDPDVLGVVGPKNSGCVAAAAPVADRAGLPLLLPAATADELTRHRSVLRLCARDAATATAAVDVARDAGAHALWVEADDTAYGIGLAAAVRAAATRAGLALAPSLAASDAAFLAMGEVEQAVRMEALRGAGYLGVLVGAEGGPGAPIGRLAGAAAEGSWQLYPGQPVDGHERVYTAEAAAGAQLLLAAYEETLDRRRIAAWLRSPTTPAIATVLGPVRFGPDGERAGAAVSVWRIADGVARPHRPDTLAACAAPGRW